MRHFSALAAIGLSFLIGAVIAISMPGCKPAAPPAPPPSSGSTTTDDVPATPVEEPPADKPAEDKPAEDKPAEDKPAEDKPAESTDPVPTPDKPAEDKPTDKPAEPAAPTSDQPAASTSDKAAPAAGDSAAANPAIKPGDWNQWGGTSLRNNTPVAEGIVTEWHPGDFDRETGAHIADEAKNIKWIAAVGSQTYGNTVVASGRAFVGTNNSHGYLKRYPADTDLGCFICFEEGTGKFLWQHSSEKLPTGRVHDWPLQGICCSPLVEGKRAWFVTSRGEVKCLDIEGYHDGEDDGPVTKEPARLFDVVKADEGEEDKQAGYLKELDAGKLPAELREMFAAAGMELPDGDVAIALDEKAKGPKRWNFSAEVGGAKRDFYFTLAGPRLSAFKTVTPDDKEEADVIWSLDMMAKLGISQHNMCSCSVTSFGDILFVNTSNGVSDDHLVIPAPDAPSFMAVDKNSGEVFWTDKSPGKNILHGQWSSPTVAVIGGVPQVLFGGGDAWLYSFKADKGTGGKPELLWKFDANPKTAVLELGGRGTRNDIISTPVVYDNKVYFCTGQDPEHGEGEGILWCLDPGTKRGDLSETLAVSRADPKKPLPVKRVQAVVEEDGDLEVPNPNSAVKWKYTTNDVDGNKKIEFEEQFHRSISTVAIKNDLLYVPDFSGLFHCVHAQTGKVLWTYDMLAAAWGSPMIVGDKVYIGDEDGDIAVFNLSDQKQEPLIEVNMLNAVYSTPIVANGVLYIASNDHLFAIAAPGAEAPKAGGE